MQMFINMKMELPLPTRILLGVSGFMQRYGLVLLPGLVLLISGMVILGRKPEVKAVVDPLLLHVPVFGMLWRKVAIARFSRTLSTLVHSGVPIISAMEAVKKTTGNIAMIKALTAAQTSMREGSGLASPLSSSGVFTPMVVQMIAIGEETGALDKMLEKVADFYESDVDDMVGRLSTILEPLLIGILGVVIGGIVISVVLPLFDVITNVGQ